MHTFWTSNCGGPHLDHPILRLLRGRFCSGLNISHDLPRQSHQRDNRTIGRGKRPKYRLGAGEIEPDTTILGRGRALRDWGTRNDELEHGGAEDRNRYPAIARHVIDTTTKIDGRAETDCGAGVIPGLSCC